MIPHRMFVAALSGGRHSPAMSSSPPLHVLVEPSTPGAGVSIGEKRRSEAVSAIALRRVLELAPRYGV